MRNKKKTHPPYIKWDRSGRYVNKVLRTETTHEKQLRLAIEEYFKKGSRLHRHRTVCRKEACSRYVPHQELRERNRRIRQGA